MIDKGLQRDFMNTALDQAKKAAARGEVPVGAVVVKEKEIIAQAHNLRETKQEPGAHAEMLALKKAARKLDSWRLEDCSLFVTLEPCLMCAGALLQARISMLVYGAKDPKNGAVDSLYSVLGDERLNHQVKVISGKMAEESSRLLKNFFQDLRN